MIDAHVLFRVLVVRLHRLYRVQARRVNDDLDDRHGKSDRTSNTQTTQHLSQETTSKLPTVREYCK